MPCSASNNICPIGPASASICPCCEVGKQGSPDFTTAATVAQCPPLRHGANLCSIPGLPQGRRFAPRLHQHAAGTGRYVAPEGVGGRVQDDGQRGHSAEEVAAGQATAHFQMRGVAKYWLSWAMFFGAGLLSIALRCCAFSSFDTLPGRSMQEAKPQCPSATLQCILQ